jgi:phage antirepressor YoqD-like protein
LDLKTWCEFIKNTEQYIGNNNILNVKLIENAPKIDYFDFMKKVKLSHHITMLVDLLIIVSHIDIGNYVKALKLDDMII